jgi:lipopolysaccharide transport system permease protein
MYATPVIYPFSQVPEHWRWLAALNPMAMPAEEMRDMFLSKGLVDPAYLAVSVGMTILILLSGAMLFSRVERTFVDSA